jgi:tripartite-type tricarboxylate transporter receptor subunit TctC
VIAQSKAGTIRPLAVTSLKRSDLLPGLPAISETVPGFDVTGWYGILAPAGTPKAVVDKLSRELIEIMHEPDMKKRVAERGVEALGTDPEQLRELIRTEIGKWGPIVKAANIKPG